MTQQNSKTLAIQSNTRDVALVGRQAIYTADLEVFGYELLYRSPKFTSNEGANFNGKVATSEVMLSTFLEMGLESVVGDKYAFINLTQEYVEGKVPIAFPGHLIVLEVLEDIDPTPLVISGIKALKAQGFMLALDDFTFEAHLMPLVPLMDILKVDIMPISFDELTSGLENIKNIFTGKLLAEKVETNEEFEQCKSLGFNYFQGYFLEKPIIIKGQKMPSNKLTTLYLLNRLQDPNIEFDELETIVKNDPSLSFKLFRYISSPFFNLNNEISSVKQVLMLLGLSALKQWMALIVIADSSQKSPDLIHKALCRAHMCEQLATLLKVKKKDQYFLLGLFSILDAMLDQAQTEILKAILLPKDLNGALISREGNMGKILNCVLAYEHGDWDAVRCGKVPLAVIQKKYFEAIEWANQHVAGLNA